jgi:hypothetical protein
MHISGITDKLNIGKISNLYNILPLGCYYSILNQYGIISNWLKVAIVVLNLRVRDKKEGEMP